MSTEDSAISGSGAAPSPISPENSPVKGRLNSHRILTFAGKDAATFLQGYLTCDTAKLDAQKALPGAFTNLKGRVVANGWVWGDATTVNMLVAESLSATVAEFLAPYMNFSRTKLQIESESPSVLIGNPGNDGVVFVDAHRALIIDHCESTTDLSSNWLAHCITTKEAVVTAPTSGAYLPQMLGLTALGAVSFDKGCYLGQEVVARAEHRGEVKRRLQGARYESTITLSAGDVLTSHEGKRMGNVICATSASVLLVSSEEPTEQQHWLIEDSAVALSFSGTTSE